MLSWGFRARSCAVAGAVGLWMAAGCSSGDTTKPSGPGGGPVVGNPTSGGPDSGAPDGSTGVDGGVLPDGGNGNDAGLGNDGGTDAGIDAGTDAGFGNDAGVITSVVAGTSAGWTFYGAANGAPTTVLGASYDGAGNLWVAGGEEGLFVLRAGTSVMQRFTMADGLHPYGFMPDGTPSPPPYYLKVLSVAGGPGATVFVGYAGRPAPPGVLGCEDNWDAPPPHPAGDPSIYKSGDADKVTLTGTGISVVHYDISTGPGLISNEEVGREKLCSIYRIVYDPTTASLWFGANHGFAWGDPNYLGDPACNGQYPCSGVIEHAHPGLNGWTNEERTGNYIWLTDAYYGIAPDPVGDVWFGGAIRTTKFKYGTNGKNFFPAESQTEDPPYIANRIDVWPDKVEEPGVPKPSDRVDDNVSGVALAADGSVWVASFERGLAHLSASGTVLGYLNTGLTGFSLSSLHADPADGSIWIGQSSGGVDRMQGTTVIQYTAAALGPALAQSTVTDIQHVGTGAARRMVVSFAGSTGSPGGVGIYSGN